MNDELCNFSIIKIISARWIASFAVTTNYFPIQNLEKTTSNISSINISPEIFPISIDANLRSSDASSIGLFNEKSSKLDNAFFKWDLCLWFNIIGQESDWFEVIFITNFSC